MYVDGSLEGSWGVWRGLGGVLVMGIKALLIDRAVVTCSVLILRACEDAWMVFW